MPQFTYTGDEQLIYTGINMGGFALVAVPGQTYELDAMPTDNRWTAASVASAPVAPATPAPEAPQTTPEAPETAATPTPDSTPTN